MKEKQRQAKAVGPQSVDEGVKKKTERYQQTCLLDLKSGRCSEKKTEVNADIKVAPSLFSQSLSSVYLKQNNKRNQNLPAAGPHSALNMDFNMQRRLKSFYS